MGSANINPTDGVIAQFADSDVLMRAAQADIAIRLGKDRFVKHIALEVEPIFDDLPGIQRIGVGGRFGSRHGRPHDQVRLTLGWQAPFTF